MKEIILLFLAATVSLSSAQFQKYRICATPKFTEECRLLQRGTSEVTCVMVTDAVNCALQIQNDSSATAANFGIFSAESTLLLGQVDWNNLNVVKEVRSNERPNENYDFASVVVVRKPGYRGGIEQLRGLTFSHPGLFYDRAHRWSELFLKEFERTIAPTKCDIVQNTTIEELEVASLQSFFSTGCRPGSWSSNSVEDARLKKKYPLMCQACDNPATCSYDSAISGSDHRRALESLKKGKGEVTYVSLHVAQQFFRENSDTASEYQFVCRNYSTTEALHSSPCTWLTQPWPTVIGKGNNPQNLKDAISRWMQGTSQWENTIRAILTDNGINILKDTALQKPRDYVRPFRPIPIENDVCEKKVSWCTTSYEEHDKCRTIKAGGVSTGTLPLIECKQPVDSTVRCLNEIKEGRADFMGIDSNYGYIARNNFELTAAMYAETDDQHYSRVIILVKANSGMSKFDDLRAKKACFPEFGGIASIAFVDVGRSRGVFRKNECNYANLIASYFDESCAPGAKDVLHDAKFRQSSPEAEKLCKLCERQGIQPFDADVVSRPLTRTAARVVEAPLEDETTVVKDTSQFSIAPVKVAEVIKEETSAPKAEVKAETPKVEVPKEADEEKSEEYDYGNDVEETETPKSRRRRQTTFGACAPTRSNRYFGTRGALRCLVEAGDVAVVEVQRLSEIFTELGLSTDDYRIMCRNGTVIPINNFYVDPGCPLVTIVDGEIVVKRNETKVKSITSALYSFDQYFNIKDDPSFKFYGEYNGQENLLFEDSTVGFVATDAGQFGASVNNYIRLFENVEKCTGNGAISVAINALLIAVTMLAMYLY